MSKPVRIAIIAITGCVIIAIAVSAIAGGGHRPAATTYRATHSQQVTNPATLLVTGTVTNTGTTAGTPVCDISASDPGGAYTGFDTITAKKPLPVGSRVFYSDSIVITGQGARYVTSVTVRCHA